MQKILESQEIQTHRSPGQEPTDWLAEALLLEDELLRQARRTPSGELIWLHPRSFRSADARPVRLGWNLYEGVTGVALFLAALDRVEGTKERWSFIQPALAPVRSHLKTLAADLQAAQSPIPSLGLSGVGGFLYSFLLIGRWLQEPELVEEAAALAALITPDRIGADETLDLLHGCAGAILALLALDRSLPDSMQGPTPIERAVACGEHLLDHRVPRCGFAHGAAGIACALARLSERTGDGRFLEAAEERAAFEHLQYDPERGNWPAPGKSGPVFMNSWCNGAPGVALGRLGLPGLESAAPVRQDLEAALATTLACPTLPLDGLCCGNLGRAEILLHAYEALGEEHLLRAAGDLASRVVARSREQSGRYLWFAPGDDRFDPSFFKGAPGAGYTFLRLARPSLLPCVLALEEDRS
jgi:lantibiotic modifying enzyme